MFQKNSPVPGFLACFELSHVNVIFASFQEYFDVSESSPL